MIKITDPLHEAPNAANAVAIKKPWTVPSIVTLSSEDTEAKVSSPGENGIVTGPS